MKSRAVLGGQFSEQLAPYLPNFKYLPTEARFIGKPIDFLVFKGMDEKKIDEVVFVEVKSGKSKLTEQEKNLKETIEKKKVSWEEYRIPEELTKKKDIDLDEL
jgi:predicted Holliday junction resolvase-like endonuclease